MKLYRRIYENRFLRKEALKINARTNSFPRTCYYNHNTHRNKLRCIKRTRILISIKFLKLEFMLNFLFDNNHFLINNQTRGSNELFSHFTLPDVPSSRHPFNYNVFNARQSHSRPSH